MTAPFFIVGFQRSGTTLLRLMLDSHPELAVPLDTVGLWARYDAKLPEYSHLATAEDARRMVTDLVAEERIGLWQVPLTVDSVLAYRRLPGFPGIMDAFHLAYAAARGKRAWGDKDPGNMLRLSTIVRWFPEARVLHIVRDGRDACLSHKTQSFGITDELACASAWREQVWWVRRMGELMGPTRYWEVRYEDLVGEPARQLMEACAFLGIAYSPSMLEYHRSVDRAIPREKRHIWPLAGEPPRADNVGRWRTVMSPSMRVAFERRAGGLLRELGYETLPGLPRGGHLAELRSLLSRAADMVRVRLSGR